MTDLENLPQDGDTSKTDPAATKKKEASSKKNIHAGHRQRQKDLYLKVGMDEFSPHVALEMLLYYVNARGDTNPLAHRLIREFGSFAGVLDASVEDLCRVEGVGKNTAVFLHMMPDVFRYYSKDRQKNVKALTSYDDFKKYCETLYIGILEENTHLICLDTAGKILSVNVIAKGSITANSIDTRLIVENATKVRAASLVLTHNHPTGHPNPSPQDMKTTLQIMKLLKPIGIVVLDHVIVGRTGTYSMGEMNILANLT